MLSNLPHLVRLNRTRVRFPSWCCSFRRVRMQQSHSGAHQKRTKQAYRDLLEEVVSVRFQTNPGAVCLWWERDPTSNRPNCKKTKLNWFGLNQLRCALWDEEVFVDSLLFSVAGHGQTWGCEDVRSLIEIWWLVMRLRRLQWINTFYFYLF